MEKPILFSTKMVQAILEGRKMQTRRVIKFTESSKIGASRSVYGPDGYDVFDSAYKTYRKPWKNGELIKEYLKCPYGEIGNLLWVRETWGVCPDYNDPRYKADKGMDRAAVGGKWKPSIFMPKKYCRLWLEVVDVRVERLQDINNRDIEQEGACDYGCTTHRLNFQDLWDSINEKRGYGWSTNPWVWVVKFKKINYEGETK